MVKVELPRDCCCFCRRFKSGCGTCVVPTRAPAGRLPRMLPTGAKPILAEEACRSLADHCGRKAGYEEDGANADAFIGELAWGNDGRLGRGPLRVGAHKGGCSITAIVSFSLLSYVARCLSAPTVKKSAAKAWAS